MLHIHMCEWDRPKCDTTSFYSTFLLLLFCSSWVFSVVCVCAWKVYVAYCIFTSELWFVHSPARSHSTTYPTNTAQCKCVTKVNANRLTKKALRHSKASSCRCCYCSWSGLAGGGRGGVSIRCILFSTPFPSLPSVSLYCLIFVPFSFF